MIRKFQEQDAKACCEIAIEDWNKSLSRFYTDKVRKRFIERYTPQKFIESTVTNDTVVYECDGKIVAFVSFRDKGDSIEIVRLFVKFSNIGKGIGTTLFNYVKNQFHGRLFVVKSSKDPITVSFYHKMGFIPVEKLENSILMELRT